MAGEVEWMDTEAAAKLLDFHPNTVYRLIREGKLPALRFPVRIRREDLDTLVERCRIKPGELAHLDPNAARRAKGGSSPPLNRAGVPDRRYGRR